MSRSIKRLMVGVGVTAGVAAAVAVIEAGRYVVHAHASAAREPQAVADWRRTFGDPHALLESYDHPNDNAGAGRLIALAPLVGIELRGLKPADGSDVPLNNIDRYIGSQAVATAAVMAPPDIVRTYLDAHQLAVDAVVQALATTDLPIWRTTYAGPILGLDVSLLGIKRLNDVLVADALLRETQNRPVEADRLMRAARQVMRSVRDEPRLITFLIAMNSANTDATVVQHLGVDTTAWRSRLGEFDYAKGVERSVEADVVARLFRSPLVSMSSRAFAVDYLDGTRTTLQRLGTLSLADNLQPPQPPEPMYQRWLDIAPGMIVSRIAEPGLEVAWRSAQYVMLNIELTDRVLEAREEKAQLGHWPDAMPAVRSMRVPGASWVYRREPGGGVSIALDRTRPDFNDKAPGFDERH